jgi:hypothetical protein
MLHTMLKGVVEAHAETAAVHDQTLQFMSQRARSEADVMIGAMTAAADMTTLIQKRIVRLGSYIVCLLT